VRHYFLRRGVCVCCFRSEVESAGRDLISQHVEIRWKKPQIVWLLTEMKVLGVDFFMFSESAWVTGRTAPSFRRNRCCTAIFHFFTHWVVVVSKFNDSSLLPRPLMSTFFATPTGSFSCCSCYISSHSKISTFYPRPFEYQGYKRMTLWNLTIFGFRLQSGMHQSGD